MPTTLAPGGETSGSRRTRGWGDLRVGLDFPLPGIKPRLLGQAHSLVAIPLLLLLLLLLLSSASLSKNYQDVEEEKGARM